MAKERLNGSRLDSFHSSTFRCTRRTSAGMEAGNDEGLTYVSYLKLLLLAEDREEKQLRMLDVIQMNLQQESTGFLLQECAYQVDIRGIGCGKHVFFALPFVENILGKQEGYPLEAKAGKSY